MGKKIAYKVICPNDEKHKIPVIIECDDGKNTKKESTFETYCPFCNIYVRVKTNKKLIDDDSFMKTYRQFFKD